MAILLKGWIFLLNPFLEVVQNCSLWIKMVMASFPEVVRVILMTCFERTFLKDISLHKDNLFPSVSRLFLLLPYSGNLGMRDQYVYEGCLFGSLPLGAKNCIALGRMRDHTFPSFPIRKFSGRVGWDELRHMPEEKRI
ncbi:hypothetical protein CEXT_473451 [Caerostris extrusa]|uniref:Uncharacterized protein n=1 Tax=Caerostris extrusa TaxID=172846 RepID=A0AAV4V4G2_CAEEX|nr:hypothetical protein CEXT_473451 [Caerostris extrusa]